MVTVHTPQIEHTAEFEDLVTPYLHKLSRFAFHLTRDVAQAEDLMQDTLLKAHRFLQSFERGTNFEAWIKTIMRNAYCSWLRTRLRENLISMDAFDHSVAWGMHVAIEEPAVAELDELTVALPYLVTDEVLQAIETLPEDFRTAVLLADMLDYSYKDIGSITGCPVGTVMSRIHRGRRRLKAQLQPYAIAQPTHSMEYETESV